MKRRIFVGCLWGGVIAALTDTAPVFAQSAGGKVWSIGILTPGGAPSFSPGGPYKGFFDGMRALGYVEGRNYTVISLRAEGNVERLPGLARKLVEARVDVIVTNGTPAVRAAQKATATTPIVAVTFADPVGSGFAATLARPGGSITGLDVLGPEIIVKRLQLVATVTPTAARLAYLVNPDSAVSMRFARDIEAAARKLGKELVTVRARHTGELAQAFETMTRERAGAVVVADDAVLNAAHRQIATLAVQRGLPALFAAAYAAEEAVLVYGPSFERLGYRGASFVDKIFKGAKPGDLPIEGPTEFDLIVNLKVAKALGLTIPDALMLQATQVIR